MYIGSLFETHKQHPANIENKKTFTGSRPICLPFYGYAWERRGGSRGPGSSLEP